MGSHAAPSAPVLPAREAKKRAKGSATSAGTGPASRIITSMRGSGFGKAVNAANIPEALRVAIANAMALAMATRNGAPLLAVYTAFPVQDPRMLMMFLLTGPVPAIVAFPLAKFFASRADKTSAGVQAGTSPGT